MDDFDALIKVKRIYYLFTCYSRVDDYDSSEIESLLIETSADLEKEFAGYARDINSELDNYDENSQMGEVIVSYNYYPLEDDENEMEIINKEIIAAFEKIGLDVEDISLIGVRD
ncbi:MAG: hypothetical protein ACFFD4_03045 [Candidatus Odinarchaeota archaeon]